MLIFEFLESSESRSVFTRTLYCHAMEHFRVFH